MWGGGQGYAADSPFLRRPGIAVKKLVLYCSGISRCLIGSRAHVIGPTSRPPRIDEAGMPAFRTGDPRWHMCRD